MERFLVELLDPGLADEFGSAVADRIEHLQIVPADAPHGAHRVGEELAVGVVTQRPGADLDAGEAMTLDGELRLLPIVELHTQDHRLQRPTAPAQAFPERLDLRGADADEFAQRLERLLEIVDMLPHDRQ